MGQGMQVDVYEGRVRKGVEGRPNTRIAGNKKSVRYLNVKQQSQPNCYKCDT